MLVLYASMYGLWMSSRTFSNVHPPPFALKAPSRTSPAGRNRNRTVYAKNGSVPSHASERRLRPDLTSGRSAPVAASVAMSYDPIFDGHCCAISAFARVCWPPLANLTFA